MNGGNAALALALDLDDSLRGLSENIAHVELSDWQERIRFGTTRRVWREFETFLAPRLRDFDLPVLTGSGDFHHLSYLLIKRQSQHKGLRVLVCDNHPDNMRFPFGIHCGSWVALAAALPHVARIDVVGICSPDVTLAYAWENHLRPLMRGKVRYWTIGVDAGWTRILNRNAARGFADGASLAQTLARELADDTAPIYLSIDKDVLHRSVARTNWDQGCLMLEDLLCVVNACSPRLVGCDITGEVSVYRYQSRWKRWLSALDDQPSIAADNLKRWQGEQIEIDRILLERLAPIFSGRL